MAHEVKFHDCHNFAIAESLDNTAAGNVAALRVGDDCNDFLSRGCKRPMFI